MMKNTKGVIDMRRPPRYYAKVYVFILPGANMANNRLEEDFRIAREIWGFDFEITQMRVNHPVFHNLTSRDFSCEGRGDTDIERLLFQLKKTYCPDPSTIAVFYTGSDSILGFGRACTKRRKLPDSTFQNPTFMNVIFISNLFAPDTLAHELGHAFYFSHTIDRVDADLNTPGIQTHVEGSPHNVMAPGHIRRFPTRATPDQILRAIQSNSPQVIFERPGNFEEEIPYLMPQTYENRSHNRRSFNYHQIPYYGQPWPGFYY
ncbi:hypothetical protein ACFOZY_00965 [Chungangia koreensis]|uniref:Uncharacterized protein n=2 Tax=Chungangia koreensis TaxID=752657 RepID=A0ABV8X432_9LACT